LSEKYDRTGDGSVVLRTIIKLIGTYFIIWVRFCERKLTFSRRCDALNSRNRKRLSANLYKVVKNLSDFTIILEIFLIVHTAYNSLHHSITLNTPLYYAYIKFTYGFYRFQYCWTLASASVPFESWSYAHENISLRPAWFGFCDGVGLWVFIPVLPAFRLYWLYSL